MQLAPLSSRWRRWRPRTLVLAVSALMLATAVLVLSVVGFGRTIGFLTRLSATPLSASPEPVNLASAPARASPPSPAAAPAARSDAGAALPAGDSPNEAVTANAPPSV